MNKEETTIQITRDGKDVSVSVMMPAWFKKTATGDFKVSMPLLGLDTNCDSEEEAEDTIREAVKLFCMACDLHGTGLVTEIEQLGWEVKYVNKKKEVFNLPKIKAPLFNNLFHTGQPQALSVAL